MKLVKLGALALALGLIHTVGHATEAQNNEAIRIGIEALQAVSEMPDGFDKIEAFEKALEERITDYTSRDGSGHGGSEISYKVQLDKDENGNTSLKIYGQPNLGMASRIEGFVHKSIKKSRYSDISLEIGKTEDLRRILYVSFPAESGPVQVYSTNVFTDTVFIQGAKSKLRIGLTYEENVALTPESLKQILKSAKGWIGDKTEEDQKKIHMIDRALNARSFEFEQ